MNEDLMQKRDELRSKELMEAFARSERSFEEVMRFLSGNEVDEVGLCKGQKFALHYDFGDDWMFTITVSKISEVQGDFKPRIVKSKGRIQQYPDWDEDEFDEE